MLRYDSAHRAEHPAERRRPLTARGMSTPQVHESVGLDLSIVVAAKDEAISLPQLVKELVAALRPLLGPSAFEILVVDDGSVDESREVLEALVKVFPELRVIVLARHVGQSAATVAGLRMARGEWVGTFDADLQNDPADLRRLWEAVRDGYDVALGWRVDRQDSWSKRLVSRWANEIRNAVLGQSIIDTGCSVRIFRRSAALRLPMFRGVHRFFGPLLVREGCSIVQLPVTHRPRAHGRSHYTFWNRSLRVVVDLLGVVWLLRRPVTYQVVTAIGPKAGGVGADSFTIAGSENREARFL